MRKPSRQVLSLVTEPSGPFLVARIHLRHRHHQPHGMDGQFGLDGEAFGGEGKAFDEAARKHAVAAQHVRQMHIEQKRGQAGQHPVAEHMAGAIGGGVGMDAPARSEGRRHRRSCGRSCGARRWRHRYRRHPPAHRCRPRCRRTCGAPHCPCPGAASLRTTAPASRARATVWSLGIVVIDIDGGAGQGGAEIRAPPWRSPLPHCSRAPAPRFPRSSWLSGLGLSRQAGTIDRCRSGLYRIAGTPASGWQADNRPGRHGRRPMSPASAIR